jgi:hypothetical protein
MSSIIYKYGPFDVPGKYVEFQGEPVHVGYQEIFGPQIFMWCKLDTEYPIQTKKYARIIPTGEIFEDKYIGTVVIPSGLVWHVVEVVE